mmetsp:Transcript_16939/g.28600  ORF Transcript_16939/g.28600 Transcript_16939/m.28600 type:complete len:109 (-) Transcript_16939:360-686(-)|eukprot:CAMPEP_0198198432 /NCGR_PEP_ID=MMETSP1445-20131203/1909_1 /TAXON_ID=36898 /ORGANISM="Pyramimonas sp., Strain CCMP2087" /LENGTH=108 /DNA_ID=CAMNT_0043867997 /DNA_START=245 /DNA_END=571 /DNA_ORIENTATION=+
MAPKKNAVAKKKKQAVDKDEATVVGPVKTPEQLAYDAKESSRIKALYWTIKMCIPLVLAVAGAASFKFISQASAVIYIFLCMLAIRWNMWPTSMNYLSSQRLKPTATK